MGSHDGLLGFVQPAFEDRPAALSFIAELRAVCRPAGGMTAVPSREVTTSQVSAVTFGFYTEQEVTFVFLTACRQRRDVASSDACDLHNAECLSKLQRMLSREMHCLTMLVLVAYLLCRCVSSVYSV